MVGSSFSSTSAAVITPHERINCQRWKVFGSAICWPRTPFRSIGTEDDEVLGTWKQSIEAGLEATRTSFPGGDIVCSMDKKAFKGWQRQAIQAYLESVEGVPLLTTHQIKQRIGQA